MGDYKGDTATEALIVAQTAIKDVLEENAKLRRALVELDCGGGNYLSTRKQIAELSGLPAMAYAWDDHITEIKKKLAKADQS